MQSFERSGATIAFDDRNRLEIEENSLIIVRKLRDRKRLAKRQASLLVVNGALRGRMAGSDDEELELVTAEFRLNYRRPAPVGRPLVVRGRLVRTDGRDVYLEGEIIDERGRTLTTAEARWRRIGRQPEPSGTA